MAATERTSLTRPTDPPTYVEFSGILLRRRAKINQFQCCLVAFMIAILIISLVVMVSYYSLKNDPLLDDSDDLEIESTPPSLQLKLTREEPKLKISNEVNTNLLTTTEWQAAVQAGQEAITSRITADILNTPLPAPSPDSRHQYAVKTSLQAGQLALGGIGELAATQYIEKSRMKLGEPSSIGSYFKNIWIPIDTCKEFSSTICPSSKYRTYDGTCNNPRNFGAALTPFVRNIPADYSDGVQSPRIGKFGKALPSAREISLKVHKPAPSTNPDFTVMLAVFGQFLDHDITATAISQGLNGSSLSCCPVLPHQHPECFPVQVGPGDPVFDLAGRNCMEFVRSAPAPQCKIGPREQLNQVTSFIDGSVIYGPDLKTADSLREGRSGLLRMYKTPDNRTLLPQSTNPDDGCNRAVESLRGRYCFSSGDGRANENLHLTTMHLLWARQHNRIAEELSKINPTWNDETVYQEARRIIGAQLQHITYNEFIPIVLGERETDVRELKPLTTGFRVRNHSVQVNPAIANGFAAAAFRFAHTLLPGLMKVTDSEKGTFSYVELHRMLFNPYSLYAKGGMESSLTTAISNAIQKATTHVTSQLTDRLFEDPLGNSTIPCGLDLVSLNIQRGRDHGLPGYTAWRQFCGLGKVQTFDELRGEMDDEALDEISKLYDHVDDIDLYTGALAENHGVDGLIGPTFKCLIGDQFLRIQMGDRFWYESDGPQAFTEGQLNEIRKTTLAKLICDCSDEIDEIQPKVMKSVSTKNPMTPCNDLIGIDLTHWKESSSPILTAPPATDKPEAWLNFEKEINTTIKELVDVFKKAQLSKNMEWVTFKDWFNKTFTELRNNVSSLHPKSAEPMKILSSNLQSKKESTEEIAKSSKLRTKFQELAANDENMEIGKLQLKDKTAVPKKISNTEIITYATYDDWMNLRNDLTINLNDALLDATGVPGPEQRNELMKNISSEIVTMKKMIASIRGKTIGESKSETSINEDGSTSVPPMDFFKMKYDVIKAIIDSVTRIQNEAPLPGDPAWATYGPEIKKQFVNIFNDTSVPSKGSLLKFPSTKSKIEEMFNSANDQLTRVKNISVTEQLSKELIGENETAVIFWNNFRDSVNKSMSKIIAKIAGKKVNLNESDYVASRDEIMNVFARFKDSFVGLNNHGIMQSPESPNDPIAESFWDDFRKALNESIESTVKNSSPGNDPAWAAFGTQIMKKFVAFKDKFAALQVQTKKLKENIVESEKIVPFDWFHFKTDIINSIVDAVNETNKNTLLTSKETLTEFTKQMIDGFGKIPSASALKDSMITKTVKKVSNPLKEKTFDWISLKNEINKTVSEIINKRIIFSSLSKKNPTWNNLTERSAMNNVVSTIMESKIDTKMSKLDELQFSFLVTDWIDFKDKVNKSLDRAIGSITKNVPPPGDPAWATFRDSIKNEFDQLKNEINSLKTNETLENGTPMKKAVSSFSDEEKRNMKKISEDAETLVDFNRELISLQDKTNKTFVGSIIGNDLAAPFIPAADWISFKQEINATIARFVKALNGTEADEWKKTKDLIEQSFVKLRNEIISMKNNVGAVP